MKKALMTAIGVVALTSLLAANLSCTNETPREPAPAPSSMSIAEAKPTFDLPQFIAEIDSEKIGSQGFGRKISAIMASLEKSGGVNGKERREVIEGALQGYINEEVLIRAARKEKIEAPADRVAQRLAKVKEEVTAEGKDFATLLAVRGQNEEAYRNELADQIRIEALLERNVKVAVTGEEIKAYYDGHPDEFIRPERAKVAHILVATSSQATQDEKEAAHARVTRIVQELIDGADFATVAQKESDDSASAKEGGIIDYFPRGVMAPEFEQAAFTTPAGKYADVVRTRFGYHIVKVIDRKPKEKIGFAEAKPHIEEGLLSKKRVEGVAGYLESLRAAMKVTVYPLPGGDGAPDSGREDKPGGAS